MAIYIDMIFLEHIGIHKRYRCSKYAYLTFAVCTSFQVLFLAENYIQTYMYEIIASVILKTIVQVFTIKRTKKLEIQSLAI